MRSSVHSSHLSPRRKEQILFVYQNILEGYSPNFVVTWEQMNLFGGLGMVSLFFNHFANILTLGKDLFLFLCV